MTRRLVISDHALLRYIERFYSIELQTVRDEIERKCGDAARAGAKKITVGSATFVFAQHEAGPAMNAGAKQNSFNHKKGNIRGPRAQSVGVEDVE
jgi:hypothetical protein